MTTTDAWRWDIFCRVVDNFGDIGICWRLSQQLAFEYGATVRLWVDDLNSFACLCADASAGASEQKIGPIEVRHWTKSLPDVAVADIVIEAFGCEIPESYIAKMALSEIAPIWVNLEYLSAEAWVDDCHLLASPHHQHHLKKFFFFPGFSPKSGGLLCEKGLLWERAAFDASRTAGFLEQLGVSPTTSKELRISLFCYENAQLPKLLKVWADGPERIRLFVTPGTTSNQVTRWLGKELVPGSQICRDSLILQGIPFLSQVQYDHLLWSCDINFVRGEDSFVRAQWAQKPFVWQIYPQADDAHLQKLDAFLLRYLTGLAESEAIAVSRFWRGWNQRGDIMSTWRDFFIHRCSIEQHTKDWVGQLDRTGHLADNLVRFVRGK